MSNDQKKHLYPALRALDRMQQHLAAKGIDVPGEVSKFVDLMWAVLQGAKDRLPLTKVDQLVEKLVIDEQDADFPQALRNRYYYSLSNVILYLRDGDLRSIEGAMEDGLEFFRYDVSNDYLLAKGGQGLFLSEQDEQKIEGSSAVVAEKDHQRNDLLFADVTDDWSQVTR